MMLMTIVTVWSACSSVAAAVQGVCANSYCTWPSMHRCVNDKALMHAQLTMAVVPMGVYAEYCGKEQACWQRLEGCPDIATAAGKGQEHIEEHELAFNAALSLCLSLFFVTS